MEAEKIRQDFYIRSNKAASQITFEGAILALAKCERVQLSSICSTKYYRSKYSTSFERIHVTLSFQQN
jgi:hypothetical protein